VQVNDLINNHNEKLQLGRSNSGHYTLGVNKFSDLSKDQLKKLYTGNKLPPYEFTNYTVRPRAMLTITETMFTPGPESVDWKAEGHVTPIKDQGYFCNSCYAFSALAAFESHLSM